jgi:hypothetical protein
MTNKRALLNHGTTFRRLCKNCPTAMARNRPVKAGMAVNRLTWKFVAPSRVRKTGRNGAAALASPTPTASTCTLLKFFFCVGVAPSGAADQLMRDRFTMYDIPDACGARLGLDGRGV